MCGPSSRRATDRCRPRNPSSPASTARRYTAPAPRRPAPRSSRCGSGSSSRAPRYSRRRAAAAGCRRAGAAAGWDCGPPAPGWRWRGPTRHRRGGRRRIGLRLGRARGEQGGRGQGPQEGKADRACHDRLRGERGTRFNSRDDNSSAARGRRGNSSNSAPAGSRPAAPAPPRIRPACWPGQAPAPGAFHGGRVSVGARRSLGGAASVPDMRGMRGVGRVSMFVAPASVRRASGAGFALTGIRPSSPKDVRRCNRSETAFA